MPYNGLDINVFFYSFYKIPDSSYAIDLPVKYAFLSNLFYFKELLLTFKLNLVFRF